MKRQKIVGIFAVADVLKPTSKAAVEALRSMHIDVTLLTGDNQKTAQSIASELGVTDVIAEVLPQDKERIVREKQGKGRKVAMIGDGINDAPALARADVGIAIGAGTDVAISSADVVLMKSDLLDAVTAVELSRATIRNVKENLFWAFLYNTIGIPLAAGVFFPVLGWQLNPMFAAAAMSLSSVFVVSNALRLKFFRPKFSAPVAGAVNEKSSKGIHVENLILPKPEELQNQLENKGEFENIRKYNIRKYKTFGKTIKKKLYISDEKERYFHIYYSDQKACAEHEQIEAKIDRMTKYLNSLKGEKATVGDGYKKYFKLEIYEDDGTIICARERTEVIQEEINLCGYFVIVTSRQMTAEEALELYKSRDVSEKLFRGDKSYLGNRSLRVQSDEAANAKIFVEFVALIVRSRMYVLLKDEMEKLDKKPNYMTVPEAIRELEKIELVRQTDGKYRMDHAVTAIQKIILKAFDMDAEKIQDKAVGLSRLLEKYAEEGK